MVTFTQNTTYEDFVEGIRPVLSGGASRGAEKPTERGDVGDVRYELSCGVFPAHCGARRHGLEPALCARHRRDQPRETSPASSAN